MMADDSVSAFGFYTRRQEYQRHLHKMSHVESRIDGTRPRTFNRIAQIQNNKLQRTLTANSNLIGYSPGTGLAYQQKDRVNQSNAVLHERLVELYKRPFEKSAFDFQQHHEIISRLRAHTKSCYSMRREKEKKRTIQENKRINGRLTKINSSFSSEKMNLEWQKLQKWKQTTSRVRREQDRAKERNREINRVEKQKHKWEAEIEKNAKLVQSANHENEEKCQDRATSEEPTNADKIQRAPAFEKSDISQPSPRNITTTPNVMLSTLFILTSPQKRVEIEDVVDEKREISSKVSIARLRNILENKGRK